MFSDPSAKTQDLLQRLRQFFDQHIYLNEARYHEEMDAFRRSGNAWQVSPLIEELKPLARAAGLWNMFLPHEHRGVPGISNLDYAPLCEVMGRVSWSGEVFNCSAPDTGNMETIERYGTEAQKGTSGWPRPMLTNGPCASSTGRTKCTAMPLRSSNWPNGLCRRKRKMASALMSSR